jgi:hypothetical protein
MLISPSTIMEPLSGGSSGVGVGAGPAMATHSNASEFNFIFFLSALKC